MDLCEQQMFEAFNIQDEMRIIILTYIYNRLILGVWRLKGCGWCGFTPECCDWAEEALYQGNAESRFHLISSI